MSKTAKAALGLMIVTMASKLLGFAREQVLGYYYGIGDYASAYITAMNIPLVIFAAVGTAIATTFIPIYMEVDSSKGKEISNKFTSNVCNVVIVLGLILSILGFIFAEPLVKLFAFKFEGEILYTTVRFSRIMIFGMVFIGLSNVMTAYLQAKSNFTVPGLIGFPYNIIIIISIILSASGNIDILAYGTLFAMASQFLFQVPFAYKMSYKYKPYIKMNDEHIKKMIWLIAPIFIGVAVNQVNIIVDRSVASAIGTEIIPALNYANRLNGFVQGLFITSVASVIYPMLSRLSADKNNEKFIGAVSTSVNSVILLMIPISIGAIVLAKPVVRLVFERGEFDAYATQLTSISLIMYSIGMTAFGLRDILSKVFYSLQDTKSPMINGALAVGINIILNIVFAKLIGYAGLPLATSTSAIICILLLFKNLKKKVGYYGQDKIAKTTIKSLIASLIMGVITWFVYKGMSTLLGEGFINEAISLLTSITLGVVSYSIVVLFMKIDEVSMVLDTIKKKLKK
ncbi:murein biosynthesis integral membrane protein MurJ [Romboutsia weinsteinii]|uniref:Probable lipid II flippase MurJ n=1 Tax=Romboutsia weinsteinii TaxID=2020949 RepID=A0A371J3P3_9FIRM|nr:murein biosynthesis integral membrane protein MurJ [Romboutsia weinsteinii]RDY27400.1 murein biosynthesis integral membrane protein MurJ [Romboutsia weinsteinii]